MQAYPLGKPGGAGEQRNLNLHNEAKQLGKLNSIKRNEIHLK